MDTQAVAEEMVAILEPVLPPGIRIYAGPHAVVIRDAADGPGAGSGEEVILVDAVYHFGLAPDRSRRRTSVWLPLAGRC